GGRASADSRASRRRRRGWCFWRSPRGRRRGRSRPAVRVLPGGGLRPVARPLAGQRVCSCGPDVGQGEIGPREQEGLARRLGERIRKTVAKIETRLVAALAEVEK